MYVSMHGPYFFVNVAEPEDKQSEDEAASSYTAEGKVDQCIQTGSYKHALYIISQIPYMQLIFH